MRIVDALKARNQLTEVHDASNPLLAVGSPDEQRAARRQWNDARTARAITEMMEEVDRKRLLFGKHWIEDESTGDFFWPFFGDPRFRGDDVTMYYVNELGVPCMLERADPPNRAELERRQALKAQRRHERENAAKAANKQRREAQR